MIIPVDRKETFHGADSPCPPRYLVAAILAKKTVQEQWKAASARRNCMGMKCFVSAPLRALETKSAGLVRKPKHRKKRAAKTPPRRHSTKRQQMTAEREKISFSPATACSAASPDQSATSSFGIFAKKISCQNNCRMWRERERRWHGNFTLSSSDW